jgi:hypothetical protein
MKHAEPTRLSRQRRLGTMHRRKILESQLAIEWTDAMQWEDVPASLRDRVRERVGELLREAAGGASRVPEVSHEDE